MYRIRDIVFIFLLIVQLEQYFLSAIYYYNYYIINKCEKTELFYVIHHINWRRNPGPLNNRDLTKSFILVYLNFPSYKTCSTEYRMSPVILQDKHDKIRKDLEEELMKCRHLLEEKIGENGLKEYAKSCSYCSSRLEILSDGLETALANLSLKVDGAEAERDFDCETNRDFALLDSAMELSDELTYLKSHVTDKKKQSEICKIKSDEDRSADLMSKQYEQLQLLIAMTSTQSLDPLQGNDLLEPFEPTKRQFITNSEQQDESIFEKKPAYFSAQNTVNDIQDIATHDKRDIETPKEQIITKQVKVIRRGSVEIGIEEKENKWIHWQI